MLTEGKSLLHFSDTQKSFLTIEKIQFHGMFFLCEQISQDCFDAMLETIRQAQVDGDSILLFESEVHAARIP